MSEKRFTYGETIDYNFFDVFEEKKYLGMVQRDSTKIVDRLNELYEDNRQLEVLLKDSEDQVETLKESNKKLIESLVQKESED